MAETLRVERENFAEAMRATLDERVRGSMGNLFETIEKLARRVGGNLTLGKVARAANQRLAFSRGLLNNDSNANNLKQLKARGHQVGVVTDRSVETPIVWPESWLNDVIAVAVFSCELGIRKPDPAIYLEVVRRLKVQPEMCTFIGDGGSNELSGARALGMDTKMLIDPNLPDSDPLDVEVNWDGARIGSLAELL
jgi:putative hydrolase of the HAD superfamily